ncbi:MAG: sulfotransferase domain-containing protein [Aestuariivirga sp.]
MKKALKPWRSFCADFIHSRNDSNIIVSYPKSGRTWQRAAVGIYIANAYGLDARECLDTRHITQAAGLPSTSYSHNGANFLHSIDPDHFLNANSLLWRGRNILLLVRDPRAILVSGFYHMTSRSMKFNGTLSEFVRGPQTGIEKILVAYNRWYKLGKETRRFVVQSYEGMHANPRSSLHEVLEFVGVTQINEKAIEQALILTNFETLKRLEREGYFKHKSLNRQPGKPNGQKVRDGIVNGYKNALTPDDLDFIQQAVNRIGNPFEAIIETASVNSLLSPKEKSTSHTQTNTTQQLQ